MMTKKYIFVFLFTIIFFIVLTLFITSRGFTHQIRIREEQHALVVNQLLEELASANEVSEDGSETTEEDEAVEEIENGSAMNENEPSEQVTQDNAPNEENAQEETAQTQEVEVTKAEVTEQSQSETATNTTSPPIFLLESFANAFINHESIEERNQNMIPYVTARYKRENGLEVEMTVPMESTGRVIDILESINDNGNRWFIHVQQEINNMDTQLVLEVSLRDEDGELRINDLVIRMFRNAQ